jgi:hypothetical protein
MSKSDHLPDSIDGFEVEVVESAYPDSEVQPKIDSLRPESIPPEDDKREMLRERLVALMTDGTVSEDLAMRFINIYPVGDAVRDVNTYTELAAEVNALLEKGVITDERAEVFRELKTPYYPDRPGVALRDARQIGILFDQLKDMLEKGEIHEALANRLLNFKKPFFATSDLRIYKALFAEVNALRDKGEIPDACAAILLISNNPGMAKLDFDKYKQALELLKLNKKFLVDIEKSRQEKGLPSIEEIIRNSSGYEAKRLMDCVAYIGKTLKYLLEEKLISAEEAEDLKSHKDPLLADLKLRLMMKKLETESNVQGTEV